MHTVAHAADTLVHAIPKPPTGYRATSNFMLIQVDVKPMFLDIIIADGQVIVDSISPSIVGINNGPFAHGHN